MEHRSDLEMILFAGLPPQEADHVRNVIRQGDEKLLAHKRAVRETTSAQIVELSEADGDTEDAFAS